MKTPYIDFNLYSKTISSPIIEELNNATIKSTQDVIRTNSRNTTICEDFFKHIFSVYNGQEYKRVYITNNMLGMKLGSLIYTKKTGASIHNSEHNAKKLAKMRKKITQKKIRKPTAGKTKTVKKTQKKK